jgi:gamma-glutamylcyclotransferase (GGCT)/AIG2-like uncharacterized protein YtfP
MASRQLVFAYGTLKRGGSNHAFMAGQIFTGVAKTVKGFRLIHLGDYPGLVPYPDDTDGVSGEVWSIDAACLARLDVLEGVNEGLYRRGRIALQPPFADAEVETYFYLLGIHGRSPIPGGTWSDPGT